MKKHLTLSLSLALFVMIGCLKSEKKEKSESHVTSAQDKSSSEKLVVGTDLIKKELKAGSGDAAKKGQTVIVHYTGWLFEPESENNKGRKFDSSLDRNQPFSFRLGSGMVIQGWDQGVEGMKIGEQRQLVIPPKLAYGERGVGQVIPPNSTLVFDIELIEIK